MIPPKSPFDNADLKTMLQGVERSFDDHRTDQEIAIGLGIIPTSQVVEAASESSKVLAMIPVPVLDTNVYL